MTRQTLDRLILLGFVIVAVLLYISTADYPGIAQKTSAKYVRFIAVSFGVLGAVQLFFSLRQGRDGETLDLFGNALRFFGLMAALIVFAVVFRRLGFFIPAAVFIPAVALLLGYRNLLVIAGSTIGILIAVYLIFVQVLAVQLPGPDILRGLF